MSDLCNREARWSSGWMAGCSSHAKCSVEGEVGWGNWDENNIFITFFVGYLQLTMINDRSKNALLRNCVYMN